jgi:lipopolysaccharide export system permease protein
MDKLGRYLFKEFLPLFFTLFLIISLIISLIFIVTISNITAGLKITFLDLAKMYFLTLPQIIFITLSLAFFISVNSLYSKLSESQELIALFSLGFKPIKILKPIIFTAIALSIVNILILFISIPYSKVALNNFKNEKRQEAKFNFQSQQVSQQFGQWSVFALKSSNNSYKNLYLYNNQENRFIIASKASLNNKHSYLNFILNNGKIYSFKKNYIIKFSKMEINQKIPKIRISIFNLSNYFRYNKKTFIKYFPFALLPLALLFFIPVISFFHPRLQKNRHLIYSLILLSIYITIAFANKNLIIALILPVLFFVLGVVIYKWKVKF